MRYRKLDKSVPSPEYGTQGAAGLDLFVREDTLVLPNTVTLVPLNVAIELEDGQVAFLIARSSTARKFGISLANSVGVIDSDYCGDDDEIKAAVINFKPESVLIRKGDKIAQLVIVNYTSVKLDEVDSLNNKSRGGFGTTDKRD